MDWKLNVDVHVAAGSDGLMLVVGGLISPLTGQQLEEILRGKPLKTKGTKQVPKPAAKTVKAHGNTGCRYCGKRTVKGKRLCADHMKSAIASAAKARAAKVTSAPKSSVHKKVAA